jgi:hypothetical protein
LIYGATPERSLEKSVARDWQRLLEDPIVCFQEASAYCSRGLRPECTFFRAGAMTKLEKIVQSEVGVAEIKLGIFVWTIPVVEV